MDSNIFKRLWIQISWNVDGIKYLQTLMNSYILNNDELKYLQTLKNSNVFKPWRIKFSKILKTSLRVQTHPPGFFKTLCTIKSFQTLNKHLLLLKTIDAADHSWHWTASSSSAGVKRRDGGHVIRPSCKMPKWLHVRYCNNYNVYCKADAA